MALRGGVMRFVHSTRCCVLHTAYLEAVSHLTNQRELREAQSLTDWLESIVKQPAPQVRPFSCEMHGRSHTPGAAAIPPVPLP